VIRSADTKTLGSSTVKRSLAVGFVSKHHSAENQHRAVLATPSRFPGSLPAGLGIVPINPSIEGIPRLDFTGSGLTIGVPSRPNHLIENTSRLWTTSAKWSAHTRSVRGSFQLLHQLVEQLSNVVNGNYGILTGTKRGSIFSTF